MEKLYLVKLLLASFLTIACKKQSDNTSTNNYPAVKARFGNNIDLTNLQQYANQSKPAYINKDNAGINAITDAKATLGRVLFYDKSLSIDNSISCGSCHKQQFAFSDTALISRGVQGGLTTRHSMRLINARFAIENRFFWDERAVTLEAQTTQPIKDHAEMGWSGQAGRPNFAALLTRLGSIDYYQELFAFVYGNTSITEQKIQECLAAFIRSIQSFDSKFDIGRATAPNDLVNFANYTPQENAGKQLFLQAPAFNAAGMRVAGGAGCQGCHRAPEFDIDTNSRNNGITNTANNPGAPPQLNNTRSPTLRDLLNPMGQLNGNLMHSGAFASLQGAINHYNNIVIHPLNNNLDGRLTPNGMGQKLQLTPTEMNNLMAFLATLTGSNVYTDKKWSDPF